VSTRHTPSQFAALRTAEIGRALGARPLSSPAEFVVVEDQYDSAMRFNRTLDTRNPYTRSGQGWFATDDQLQHEFKASSLVIYLIAVALIVAVAVGSLQ
jgi:hypothetical protein